MIPFSSRQGIVSHVRVISEKVTREGLTDMGAAVGAVCVYIHRVERERKRQYMLGTSHSRKGRFYGCEMEPLHTLSETLLFFSLTLYQFYLMLFNTWNGNRLPAGIVEAVMFCSSGKSWPLSVAVTVIEYSVPSSNPVRLTTICLVVYS